MMARGSRVQASTISNTGPQFPELPNTRSHCQYYYRDSSKSSLTDNLILSSWDIGRNRHRPAAVQDVKALRKGLVQQQPLLLDAPQHNTPLGVGDLLWGRAHIPADGLLRALGPHGTLRWSNDRGNEDVALLEDRGCGDEGGEEGEEGEDEGGDSEAHSWCWWVVSARWDYMQVERQEEQYGNARRTRGRDNGWWED